MRKFGYSSVAALMLSSLFAVGCGEISPASPVAPSVPSSIAPQESGIQLSSSSATTTARWGVRGGATPSAATSLVVEGTDVITAVTGTCPAIVITIRNTPVTVDATTVFGTGTTCAALAVDTTVHVKGLLTFGVGGAASVVATDVTVQDTTTPTTETVKGTVASVTGTCPAVTVTLQGTAGVVVTNATTTFTPSGSCGTIAVGKVIEAQGTRNATSQLAATALQVVPDANPGEPIGHGHKKVNGEGTAAHITGTCPTLSMIVRGVRVTTTAATAFQDGACSALRNGTKVVVYGNQASDGTVTATSVRMTKIPGNGK